MEPLNPRLLCVLSDQYFLPGLLHNMRYGETLRKWFGADLFGTLARHLLRPKAWIVEQAVQFYETRLDGLPSVGIQLRTATMKGHDMQHLVTGMNGDSFAWKDWPNAFWKCAYLAAAPARGTRYFIATDSERIKALADKVNSQVFLLSLRTCRRM